MAALHHQRQRPQHRLQPRPVRHPALVKLHVSLGGPGLGQLVICRSIHSCLRDCLGVLQHALKRSHLCFRVSCLDDSEVENRCDARGIDQDKSYVGWGKACGTLGHRQQGSGECHRGPDNIQTRTQPAIEPGMEQPPGLVVLVHPNHVLHRKSLLRLVRPQRRDAVEGLLELVVDWRLGGVFQALHLAAGRPEVSLRGVEGKQNRDEEGEEERQYEADGDEVSQGTHYGEGRLVQGHGQLSVHRVSVLAEPVKNAPSGRGIKE
mmetsp:Transcript_3470/g.4684  ORF Transcript_3470/g.4684 Transcript_3470/m.4684 type:complete len:263 (-) Transcript_3470:1300-2088(-)